MAKAKKSPILPIVIVVAVLAVLGIVGYLLMNKGGVSTMGMKKNGGAFSSIKDALSKSVSLECNYKDPTSGADMKVWIKNGAIRSDMPAQGSEEGGTMIMKDKKMYIWNGNEGLVMSLETPEGQELETSDTGSEADNLIKDLEAYKNDCKPAVVSDSLFTPPSDVKFTDMSALMPSGTQQMDSSEEVENYMQQYQEATENSDQ